MAMKTRQLVRKHGWTPVTVNSEKVNDRSLSWFERSNIEFEKNSRHYKEIMSWCEESLGPGNYACTMQHGGSFDCEKRFIFKSAKHATLFRLKWL